MLPDRATFDKPDLQCTGQQQYVLSILAQHQLANQQALLRLVQFWLAEALGSAGRLQGRRVP